MAQTTQEPLGKVEQMLVDMINGEPIVEAPENRIEGLLMELADAIEHGGGGEVTGVKGSAESTYRKGNVSISKDNIGLGNADNTSDLDKPVSTAQQTALDGKVDKVAGKGLSTNDYTDTDKELVDTIPNLAPVSLIKDTVGWTGKNLLKNVAATQTLHTVTYTVNNDGSVTVNGTGTNPNAGVKELNQHFTLPAGKYLLSGSPHDVFSETGFRLQIYNWTDSVEVVKCDTDEDVQFTIGENKDIAVRIWFKGTPSTGGNNVTFYPMIRRADIIDDTYEPYRDSVDKTIDTKALGYIKDTVGWTGKNLLKNMHALGTFYGVTFTQRSDGSILVNGTATQRIQFNLQDETNNDVNKYKGQKVILSGCPSGGSAQTYSLDIWWANVPANHTDTGNGVEIQMFDTVPSNFNIKIDIKSGVTCNNLVFYPMMRSAAILDSTFEPYHESVEVMYEEEIHGINLLKNQGFSRTINGLTYVYNTDGSVTVNGTATANSYVQIKTLGDTNPVSIDGIPVILSGAPAGSAANKYWIYAKYRNADNTAYEKTYEEYGNGIKFTIPNGRKWEVYTAILNGQTVNNLTFYPMIRKADIEDSIYRPYNYQAIQNQLNDKGVLGAKNLFNQVYKTVTQRGVTFTANSDGTVTASGTATGGNAAISEWDKRLTLPKGRYIWSGCPTGGTASTFASMVQDTSADPVQSMFDYGNGVEFEVTDETHLYAFYLGWVREGATVNNVTFKPMLRLASDPDDTYQPYAMTNKELTEKVFEKRILTSADDLDDILETGIYEVTTAPANSPEGRTYYTLLVEARSAIDARQIAFVPKSSESWIYMRSRGGSPVSWRSWYKFTGTIVS